MTAQSNDMTYKFFSLQILSYISYFPEGKQVSVLSQPKDCSAPECEPVNVGPALFSLPANQTNQIDQQTNPDNNNKDIFNSNALLVLF